MSLRPLNSQIGTLIQIDKFCKNNSSTVSDGSFAEDINKDFAKVIRIDTVEETHP
jgi:hypothetical protein